MQIELKSNRHFIFKALLPIVILISVILISMIFVLVDDYGVWLDFRNDIIIISIGGLCEITAISIILFAKFYKGKSYIFTENAIVVYKRGQKQETISMQNVEGIHYYQWKFRYIITIFAGALNEGGCWKLHIWTRDGAKKEIGFFSVKDIKILQEKLYSEIIIY